MNTGLVTANIFKSDHALSGTTEVYVNGQLLLAGVDASTDNDYYPGSSAGNVKFEFALVQGDVVQVISRTVND